MVIEATYNRGNETACACALLSSSLKAYFVCLIYFAGFSWRVIGKKTLLGISRRAARNPQKSQSCWWFAEIELTNVTRNKTTPRSCFQAFSLLARGTEGPPQEQAAVYHPERNIECASPRTDSIYCCTVRAESLIPVSFWRPVFQSQANRVYTSSNSSAAHVTVSLGPQDTTTPGHETHNHLQRDRTNHSTHGPP